jgi:hypothetical protein
MPAPVEIDFTAGGVAQVLRAFDSLETKAERFERSFTTASESGSRSRASGTKREVDQREKEYQKLVKQTEAWEKSATKAVEKEATQRAKAEENAGKAATKAAERESKNRQKLATEEARAEERVWAQSLRERERMAKAATRVEQEASRERERIAEREANRSAALERRWSRRSVRRGDEAAIGSFGRMANGAASLLGGALTVGGGFAVGAALRDEMKFGEAVAQTSNAAFVEGDSKRTRAMADPAKIAALAKHVEHETNISKVDAVEALHKYVNLASDLTGMSEVNKTTGRTNIEEMARMAKGSGANFGDLMTAAGYLKAENPGMGPEELNLRMRQMLGAGAKGDIAISDMARYANKATANAGQFAGSLGENQAKMLGLAQIAGRVADPAEAAEAVNKLAFDVAKHTDKTGAAGIKVMNKAGKILDPSELIGNFFQATGGSVGKLSDLGIDARSMKLFAGLQPTFDAAEARKKGSGADAVRSEVSSFEHVNFSQEAADTNFANVMNTDTEKLSGAMQKLEETVNGAASGPFKKFVDGLAEHQGDIEAIIKGLGALATAFIEHPIIGVGAAIIAQVTKDVGAAKLGVAIEKLLATSITPGTSGAGGAGAAAAGAAGAGGVTVGGALAFGAVVGGAVLSAGVEAYDFYDSFAHPTEDPDEARKRLLKSNNIQGLLADMGQHQEAIDSWKGKPQTEFGQHVVERQQAIVDAEKARLKELGVGFDAFGHALAELTRNIVNHGKTIGDSHDVLNDPLRSKPIGPHR